MSLPHGLGVEIHRVRAGNAQGPPQEMQQPPQRGAQRGQLGRGGERPGRRHQAAGAGGGAGRGGATPGTGPSSRAQIGRSASLAAVRPSAAPAWPAADARLRTWRPRQLRGAGRGLRPAWGPRLGRVGAGGPGLRTPLPAACARVRVWGSGLTPGAVLRKHSGGTRVGSWFGAGATRFSLPDPLWPCPGGFWKARQLLPTARRNPLLASLGRLLASSKGHWGCRESAAVPSRWPSRRIVWGVRGLGPARLACKGHPGSEAWREAGNFEPQEPRVPAS